MVCSQYIFLNTVSICAPFRRTRDSQQLSTNAAATMHLSDFLVRTIPVKRQVVWTGGAQVKTRHWWLFPLTRLLRIFCLFLVHSPIVVLTWTWIDLRNVSRADIFQWWNQHSLGYQLNIMIEVIVTTYLCRTMDVLSILASCHLMATHVCLESGSEPVSMVFSAGHVYLSWPALAEQLAQALGGVLSVHSTWT